MNKDNNVISISELAKNVISQAKLIILTTIIVLLVVIAAGLLEKPKFDVESSIKLNYSIPQVASDEYAIDIVTLSRLHSYLLSKNAYNDVAEEIDLPEKFDYKAYRKFISINSHPESDTISFTTKSAKKPELYASIFQLLMEHCEELIKSTSLEGIDTTIDEYTETIQTAKEFFNETVSDQNNDRLRSDIVTFITNKEGRLKDLINLRKDLDDPISYFEKISLTKLDSKILSIQTLAIAGILGVFIGICLALYKNSMDKHIYTTNNVLDIVSNKHFIGAVPLIDSEDPISNIQLKNCISRINTGIKELNITSLTAKSGKKIIHDKLSTIQNTDATLKDIKITQSCSILEDPIKAIDTAPESANLIILKAGTDIKQNLANITKSLDLLHSNYYYILNFAEGHDSSLLKTNETYRKKNIFKNFNDFYKNI